MVITARDYSTARDIVIQLYGNRWSDLYTEETFEPEVEALFSRGALLNIQVPDGH